MFILLTCPSHNYPSGWPCGKPPFSFRGPSGTAFFLILHLFPKQIGLTKARKGKGRLAGRSLLTWTPAQIITFLQFCFRKPFREASGGNVPHFVILWYHDWGLSGLLWLLSRVRSNLTKETLKPQKGFQLGFRETPVFLPGTFRDCGVLACSKTWIKHTIVTQNRLANHIMNQL